ncbi:MAG: HD domain-containing phosphohydrolase [Dehalococcoidia bacterium]
MEYVDRATHRPPADSTPSVRGGPPRAASRWLGRLADVLLGPTEAAAQRQDVVRRAVVAAAIVAILPIQQMHIPGWPGVIGACIVALLYDAPLAYLVFVKQRHFLARVLGTVLDSVVLMGASFFVFREMGAAGSDSSIWLVFIIYITTGGFALAPVGSLFYTALWTAWFALGTLLYFNPESLYYEELPIRLVFMALIGLVSLAMASELQKRRERLEQQNRETMGMLATLVEARDTDAGAHLYRIQHLSQALAMHLGFSEREAQEIAYASMLHDVGKAKVPDAILKKAGPLNPDEWRVMQGHTIWGEHLLMENNDFGVARLVARAHHEHWDGSGYPDGLAGEAIPFAARVVAVADVYDALISARPYKEAWPAEAAIREIQRMAGSHLDPSIVEVFVGLCESGVIRRLGLDDASPGDASSRAA